MVKEVKKIKFIKEEDNLEEEIESKDQPRQKELPQETLEIRRIALDELVSPEIDLSNLEQEVRWNRIDQTEEEKKEHPLYDLKRATEERGYHSISNDYKLVGTDGDYEAARPAGFENPHLGNQTGFERSPKITSYETSSEHELKERRKREFW